MTHQHHHHHRLGQQNITNNIENKNLHDKNDKESFENITLLTKFLTHFGFYILMFLGFINHLLFKPKISNEKNREGYAPLYENYETFYLNYVYRRIKDCWNQPICSVPGANVTFKDRITRDNGWTFEFTGTESQYINLGSYNYLGFAESSGSCANKSIEAIKKYGITSSSPRVELGSMAIHKELELLTARYLQVEDAIVFGMGFATNSLNIPSIVHQGCLVISDEKNHASTILGLRLSGATIKKFKHNDMNDLNKCLKYAIVNGQINNGKPWKKILIIVEGIYSMEGSIVNLPEIISLKKKYKAYVYLDEAHSTGAMGKKGRGICNYYGIDPKEIDILMGTFTKSFGSSGGYIAGNKKLINYLRLSSHANVYAVSMSPPIAQQIITSMKIIMGEDGTDDGSIRIQKLAINTKYFRRRLNQIGLVVYGNEDSPIVPMIVYHFSKITSVVRYLRNKNIATVGVGFPATEMMLGRIRFCISAAHTKQQLDYVLENIEEMADLFGLRYSRKPRNKNTIKNYSYDNETE
ncbi:serine palmitoyltransferase 2-like [Aphidius gifuensis]|uniref:serine palmitoyltransferase 2-like n=1 Tax=Aphidius gifuensis TaxID=684658 RepID=UPI001CDB80ED|nr:serine palmitoyltransferase 2-like [Aphidius gifuensis]